MSETDDILKALDDPEPVKKPSKIAPKIALYFADFIFLVLDIGSGLGVYWLTGIWYYGAVVFLAGFVPLMLHQKLYTHPYASKDQKNAALLGGVISVGSVLAVAIFIAIVNFAARAASAKEVLWMEIGLAVSLVLIAFTHAIITAYYFYIDEETNETQKTNRIVARGNRKVDRIKAAQMVANSGRNAANLRKQLERNFSPEVVNAILQMFRDDDGDGVPNFVDRVDNRRFANEMKAPPGNPTPGQDE